MKKDPGSVAFHTLGCKLNFAETSTIARKFENVGYEKRPFDEEADLYVINTCSVTENADKEFRKIVNRAKRRSPHAKIAVIGCYAQLKPELIAATSKVDLVLGMKEKFNLLDHLHTNNDDQEPVVIGNTEVDQLHGCIPSYSLGDRTRSFLKIQDGCDYPCTYCTIPLARGKSRSIDPEILLKQAREIGSQGVKEIVLTGVNVGDYRWDTQYQLLELLKQLDQVDSIQRIRISSIEPNLLTDDIVEFVARSNSILPHFHIPLQSGSDTILRLMKRRYVRELFASRVNKVREHFPEAGIGIDVIVGFPGETDAEFMETYEFLKATDFSYLHVFTYSERSDTEAISLPGSVDLPVRKERNRLLTQLSDEKNMAFTLAQLGKRQQVLFETWKNGILSGMTENYLRLHVKHSNSDLVNTIATTELVSLADQKLFGSMA
ncbi:MAG: tRNA (N(6)-L-threonylcarbamoyladenosine(37)-C(2))-methylthiotransferase MtaB [Candidatus Marinimicrobia bacterium]|nr:tRNA (N(6)-L-threonylcarbamoyladenosine(37)-C(2))-methylthiotransferase MtaB [Candidatus Neomarinimicrobiota bacterium]MCF7851024.1 tRNA (N(6)-L-threonylcarbamoyladenosine(37)-C(2))-methylthiotransferase MtaB [Candidatus Neomarinimicrobiota bacterium]